MESKRDDVSSGSSVHLRVCSGNDRGVVGADQCGVEKESLEQLDGRGHLVKAPT